VHYRAKGLEIRSENAAKPMTKPASPLRHWLGEIQEVSTALDYGCGKLRYSGALARKCSTLTLVDSEVQLSREQQLGRTRSTVRQYARRHWPKCRVLNIDQFGRDRRTYDFVLCANVLSAIPDKRVRSITLLKIASVLGKAGRCLFVAQYRNSYFKKVAASPNAIAHLDGWILETRRGAFYFGTLNKQRLTNLLIRHDFLIEKEWIEGESAYVLARRKDGS
jgi:hypothetical protein